MITESLSTLKIHKLTQEQYNRALAAGNIDDNALYLTPDEEIDLSSYATVEQLGTKADSTHNHEITDINELRTTLYTINEDISKMASISDLSSYALKDDLTNGNIIVSNATSSDTSTSSVAIMTSGTGVAYTATVPNVEALTAGISFIMVPNTVSTTTTPTLNVNNLGAKGIRRRLSNVATSVQQGYVDSWLAVGKPFRVIYDGDYWIVEGQDKPVAADMYGLSASTSELNHCEGVTSNIQTQLNERALISSLSNYYTKTEVDDLELITVDDIDTICGLTI